MENFQTHWQWYRNFFAFHVLRLFIVWFALVPLLLRVLSDLPPEIPVELDDVSFVLHLSLPFNWIVLWIASICFAIAFAIYGVSCPGFIRKYPTFTEYKSYYHSPRWIAWEAELIAKHKLDLDKFIDRLAKKHYLEERQAGTLSRLNINNHKVIVEQNQSVLYFEHNGKEYSFAMPRVDSNGHESTALTEIAEREVFWEIFGRYSSSKPLIRWIVRALLVVAALLFIFTVLQHVISVPMELLNDAAQ